MNSQTLGIIIGGIMPAILFGLSGTFIKSSTQAGIGIPLYLVIVGLGSVVTGGLFYLFHEADSSISLKSGIYSALVGVTWAIGGSFIIIGLSKFQMPLSKLVPLYNMNTLIAVLLSLWLFAEWKTVSMPPLLLGSVFIVVGGILVSNA